MLSEIQVEGKVSEPSAGTPFVPTETLHGFPHLSQADDKAVP